MKIIKKTFYKRHFPMILLQTKGLMVMWKSYSLHWRHNGRDCVLNPQPYDCLLNRLFRRRSKKTSKLCVTGLCEGNSPGTGEFPHKWPVTWKMFPFGDVIMSSGCWYKVIYGLTTFLSLKWESHTWKDHLYIEARPRCFVVVYLLWFYNVINNLQDWNIGTNQKVSSLPVKQS